MTVSGQVDLIREVAGRHREKLLERVKKVNDPAFASGASWAIFSLDRILLACDGETNRVKLSLEGAPPSTVVVQEALFGLTSLKNATRHCVECGRGIGPSVSGRQSRIAHCGRGLCTPCYRIAEREGRLDDYEKRTYSRDELLDEWVILCRDGYTRDAAAARLKMKPKSFKRALERARKDGDPRALRDRHQCDLRNFAS